MCVGIVDAPVDRLVAAAFQLQNDEVRIFFGIFHDQDSQRHTARS